MIFWNSFFHRLKWRGRDIMLPFNRSRKLLEWRPVKWKRRPNHCTGWIEILVKFKFDYACCCVTVLSLTLGSSHKSIQCPENCFRWRPRADVTTVRATALEFGPDQVKSRSAQSQRSPAIVKKCGLPFFPSGLFLESTILHALTSSPRAQVIYWPSKFHKQGPRKF